MLRTANIIRPEKQNIIGDIDLALTDVIYIYIYGSGEDDASPVVVKVGFVRHTFVALTGATSSWPQ